MTSVAAALNNSPTAVYTIFKVSYYATENMYFFVSYSVNLSSFVLFSPSVTKVIRISIVGRTDRPYLKR